jgi:hypothetical protein
MEANVIVALKERSAKGGRAAKVKAYAKERASKAAKARHSKRNDTSSAPFELRAAAATSDFVQAIGDQID